MGNYMDKEMEAKVGIRVFSGVIEIEIMECRICWVLAGPQVYCLWGLQRDLDGVSAS